MGGGDVVGEVCRCCRCCIIYQAGCARGSYDVCGVLKSKSISDVGDGRCCARRD